MSDDAVQDLIDEWEGLASGRDKASYHTLMRAQKQHKARAGEVAELKSALEGRDREVANLKEQLSRWTLAVGRQAAQEFTFRVRVFNGEEHVGCLSTTVSTTVGEARQELLTLLGYLAATTPTEWEKSIAGITGNSLDDEKARELFQFLASSTREQWTAMVGEVMRKVEAGEVLSACEVSIQRKLCDQTGGDGSGGS